MTKTRKRSRQVDPETYTPERIAGLEETRAKKALQPWEDNASISVRADKATLKWLKSLGAAARGDLLDQLFRELPGDVQKEFEQDVITLRPPGWERPKITPHKPHKKSNEI